MRRDEAAARAREEEEEQRMRDVDSARRLAVLRGEQGEEALPPPSPPAAERREDGDATVAHPSREKSRYEGLERGRKRKRAGEDDTDFEMRVARERMGTRGDEVVKRGRGGTTPVVLTDAKGHIDLFGSEGARGGAGEKNEEAEREKAKKKRDEEDLYTMRFVNAAGKGSELGHGARGPWYARSGDIEKEEEHTARPGKDAFGNDDPRRHGRDAARMNLNDPLAMMKNGARRVREIAAERRRENEERERELKALRKEERRREKRRRRKRDEDADSLEGFSLEARPEEDDDGGTGREGGQDDERRRHHRDSRHRDSERRSRRRSSREGREDEERGRKHRHHRSRDVSP